MDNVNIQISKDLIAPIVETKMKAAILEAMGDTSKLVEYVVNQILYAKVNEKGVVGSYSSENKFSWIDIALRKSIEDSCKEVIQQVIKEQSEAIKENVKKHLTSKKGMSAMASAMMDSMVKAAESSWRFSTEFKFQSDKDY